MSLRAELQRRHVFKVGAAYLVVAWLAVQAASIGFPAFDAPPWALRVFILVALLGFPAAVVLAWVFERTPHGVAPDAPASGGKLVFGGAALLGVLALGWYFHGQPSFRKGDAAAPVAAAGAPAIPQKSIAVLPFTDLSPGHDHEYFSDGMAEEVLNALAKVKDLKVAGRTSSFSFRGRGEGIPAIGKALGVANVLEGSVRQQGDKVRITAQLIRTDDDFHVWSETYDGDLGDVFALQERIARAITERLQVVLQGEQKTRLVPVATSSPEAYALYLQATAIFNRRDGTHFPDAIAALKQAIALDPGYARAHSRLAALYDVVPQYSSNTDVPAALAAAQQHARAAIALDPTLAEPHAALGLTYRVEHRYVDERAEYERALALDPNDVTTNFWYGLSELMQGYTAHGLQLLDRTLAIDAMLPNALRWRAQMQIAAGDLDAAQRNAQRARDLGLQLADMNLAQIAHQRGDDKTAIARWTSGLHGYLQGLPDGSEAVIANGLYGDPAARARAVALIDAYLAVPRDSINWVAPYALAQLGEAEKALAAMQTSKTNNDADFLAHLWSRQGQALRASPAFPAFVRAIGLVELWDKLGPPDACKANAGGDYACGQAQPQQ